MPSKKRNAESEERFESAEESGEDVSRALLTHRSGRERGQVKPKVKRQSTSKDKVCLPHRERLVTALDTDKATKITKSEPKSETGLQENEQGDRYAKVAQVLPCGVGCADLNWTDAASYRSTAE